MESGTLRERKRADWTESEQELVRRRHEVIRASATLAGRDAAKRAGFDAVAQHLRALPGAATGSG